MSNNAKGRGRAGTLTHRIERWVLTAASIAFIGITGWLLFAELEIEPGAPGLIGRSFTTEVAQAPMDDCLGLPDEYRQAAVVSIAIRHLDRQASILTVDIGLCLPPALKDRLFARGHPVLTTDPRDPLTTRVEPHYARVPVKVEWANGLPDRGGPHALPVALTATLSQLNSKPGDGPTLARVLSPVVPLGRLEIPLAGAPRRYPLDWYALSGSLNVAIGRRSVSVVPSSTSPSRLPGVPETPQTWLPFRITIVRDPNLAALSVVSSVSPFANDATRQLAVSFTRSSVTQSFVLIVGSIPLFLALLLFSAMRLRAGKEINGFQALAGVTAALLAVLPIRAVLVPGDVSDLTLVDYSLGFEMAVLAALACLAERRII